MMYVISLFFLLTVAIWLLICGILSFFGIPLKGDSRSQSFATTLTSKTICKTLYESGRLSQKLYNFEVYEVAPIYGMDTFRGYLFIIKPIIPLMLVNKAFESFVLKLVYMWIDLHEAKLKKQKLKNPFFASLVSVSVGIAKNLGKFLRIIKDEEELV